MLLLSLHPRVVGFVLQPFLAFLGGGGGRSCRMMAFLGGGGGRSCRMSRTTSCTGSMGLAARDGGAVGTSHVALVQLAARSWSSDSL